MAENANVREEGVPMYSHYGRVRAIPT